MKKHIVIILLATAITGNIIPAFAQNKAYEIKVDGVKVIVQPSGNDIVEIQTIIKGGVQNYPADKMGVESLAINALTECGTLNHDKNSFKNALDKVSAQVYGYSDMDYSVIRMNCIKPDFDNVWKLYAEAITQPRFDTSEFKRIKQDAINSLKARESQPDAAIDKFANKVAFAGRDYSKEPQGTQAIIEKLKADETRAYYQSILTRSRIFIVVVADLDRSVIESKVKEMLAGIKRGAPYELKKSFFRTYKNTFSSEPRDLATNYVEGITSGPQLDAPDFYAFSVAMRIFANRHFLDIRTRNGLSYSPRAWFNTGTTSVAKFAVSTTQPDKYIAVFDRLVDSTKTHGFTAAELADMKVTYLTGFYYKNETNVAQASSIAANEVLHDDWKRSLTLMEDIKKLKLEDVNTAFRNYIGNIVWVYQGDTKKVNPVLFTNGTIKKPDNPVGQ
ncbi:MAG: zinc protease [Mucilaginibacter sp.]|nr:zinc protease [Mucilaginibacter sp.]